MICKRDLSLKVHFTQLGDVVVVVVVIRWLNDFSLPQTRVNVRLQRNHVDGRASRRTSQSFLCVGRSCTGSGIRAGIKVQFFLIY